MFDSRSYCFYGLWLWHDAQPNTSDSSVTHCRALYPRYECIVNIRLMHYATDRHRSLMALRLCTIVLSCTGRVCLHSAWQYSSIFQRWGCKPSLHVHRLTVGRFVQTEVLQKKSLRLCVTFLEQIAKMTSSVVLELCAEQCNLNEKVTSRFVSNREIITLQRLSLPNCASICDDAAHSVSAATPVCHSW